MALLLAALLLCAACRRPVIPEESTEPTEESTLPTLPEGSITVPYTELDPLNPFFTETLINFSLISLVYDSLYYLDGGFTPIPLIAEECAQSEQTLRVIIDDALVFSDMSPLGAADVVYSFTMAKESPLYAESLAGFESCEADGAYSLTFTLSAPDVNALNLLTFPIVKLGTADEPEQIPVGSGCYKYMRDELRMYLEYNLRHAGGIPEIGTIRLREVNESATLMHQLNTGSIDCFFTDMADGIAKRSYSGTNEIYLNNLVFLGVNHNSALLGTADVRKAVSLAVSRLALVENAYVSHARTAVFPFNSSWDALSELPQPQNAAYEADLAAADAILAQMQQGSEGSTLYYTLLVEDDNAFLRQSVQLIKEQLALINFDITVETMNHTAFEAALLAGNFDFYLSEIKLTKNMDLSPFFTVGGAAAWGIDLAGLEADDIYAQYRAGETELTRFLEAFDDALPFLPLLYRNGQFCYSRTVKGGVEATEDRLFLNIAQWRV